MLGCSEKKDPAEQMKVEPDLRKWSFASKRRGKIHLSLRLTYIKEEKAFWNLVEN